MRMLSRMSGRFPFPLEDEPKGGLLVLIGGGLGNHSWSYTLLFQRFLGQASSRPRLFS